MPHLPSSSGDDVPKDYLRRRANRHHHLLPLLARRNAIRTRPTPLQGGMHSYWQHHPTMHCRASATCPAAATRVAHVAFPGGALIYALQHYSAALAPTDTSGDTCRRTTCVAPARRGGAFGAVAALMRWDDHLYAFSVPAPGMTSYLRPRRLVPIPYLCLFVRSALHQLLFELGGDCLYAKTTTSCGSATQHYFFGWFEGFSPKIS